MLSDYAKVRKLAQRQVRKDIAAGRFPHPPALDDMLQNCGSLAEVTVGTIEIDLSLLCGTKTAARQQSFSSNFLPLLDESTEFAAKWSQLFDYQQAEGIRDPILCYEYLQRFYVQEGNKRVSVLRYLDNPTIEAKVIRVLPLPSDDPQVATYQDFLRFYKVAPVYGIITSDGRTYAKIAAIAGQDLDQPWPEDKVRALRHLTAFFSRAYSKLPKAETKTEVGDALLTYLEIYGLDDAWTLSPAKVDDRVRHISSEFNAADVEAITYMETPSAEPSAAAKVIPALKTATTKSVLRHVTRVAFLFDETPDTSGWDALHERGRLELEEIMAGRVETLRLDRCGSPEAFSKAVEAAVADEDRLIVTTSFLQLPWALKAAVDRPRQIFVNCSTGSTQSAVRSFGGRLYEAKFVLGALAASVAPDHRIGYVADSLASADPACINAFARGAALVDSHARVILAQESAQDAMRHLMDQGIEVISGPDYRDPLDPTSRWGLCLATEAGTTPLAWPAWQWGRYYSLMVRSIEDERWRQEGRALEGRSLNYWWGMAEGVLDVHLSDQVSADQERLVRLMRDALVRGMLHPFEGDLRDQAGSLRHTGPGRLTAREIVDMDWLSHNVEGKLIRKTEGAA